MARFHPDGTPDDAFSPGRYKLGAAPAGHRYRGNAVALQADGGIIVAGTDGPSAGPSWSNPLLMRFSGASNAPAAVGSSTASTPMETEAAAIDAALLFLLTEELATPTNKRK